MDRVEQFYELIRESMTATLATASDGSVTMRLVSPVCHQGEILIFTAPDSEKYRQLMANPHCCVAVGTFFAECTARVLGATMLDGNEPLRAAYSKKFPGAFDEGIAFGGRDAAFILLKPFRLKGWAFENDVPTPDGVPSIPFDIALNG